MIRIVSSTVVLCLVLFSSCIRFKTCYECQLYGHCVECVITCENEAPFTEVFCGANAVVQSHLPEYVATLYPSPSCTIECTEFLQIDQGEIVDICDTEKDVAYTVPELESIGYICVKQGL